MNSPYNISSVDHAIFRAYDIRGIVGTQINADVFYTIGKAIGYRLHSLNRSKIVLARDGRLTSPDLAQALCSGLLDSDIDVVDLGGKLGGGREAVFDAGDGEAFFGQRLDGRVIFGSPAPGTAMDPEHYGW